MSIAECSISSLRSPSPPIDAVHGTLGHPSLCGMSYGAVRPCMPAWRQSEQLQPLMLHSSRLGHITFLLPCPLIAVYLFDVYADMYLRTSVVLPAKECVCSSSSSIFHCSMYSVCLVEWLQSRAQRVGRRKRARRGAAVLSETPGGKASRGPARPKLSSSRAGRRAPLIHMLLCQHEKQQACYNGFCLLAAQSLHAEHLAQNFAGSCCSSSAS